MSRLFDDASSEEAAVSAAVITTYPFTMAAWFNSDDAANRQTILSIADASSDEHWFRLEAAGSVAGDPVRFNARGGPAEDRATSSTGYSTDTWHHACGVGVDNQDRTVYLDGGSSGTNVSSNDPAGLDKTVVGGRGNVSGGQSFSGKVAEAAIWDAVLGVPEIQALAAGISPLRIRPQSLLAYWPLYGNDSPEPCVTNGTFDLTLTGSTKSDHIYVYKPAMPFVSVSGSGGAPGGLSIPVAMHSYRRRRIPA